MRRRSVLAAAGSLYRLRLKAVGPDGVEKTWYEGPFEHPQKLWDLLVSWQERYEREERFRGSLVEAELEWSSLCWRPTTWVMPE